MNILALLSWFNPKRLLVLGGALVLMYVVYMATLFIAEKYELENQVRMQRTVIQQNQIRIDGLVTSLNLANEATAVAEEILNSEIQRSVEIESARQRALQVDPEDNGAVAPVLLDALDTIREFSNE